MRLLIGFMLLTSCGGGGEGTSTPAARTGGEEVAPAVVPAAPLTLGEARVAITFGKGGPGKMTDQQDGSTKIEGLEVKLELILHADGRIESPLDKQNTRPVDARITAAGEYKVNDKVVARIDAEGNMTALHESKKTVEGKVTEEKSEMRPVGQLAADGSFRGQDGLSLAVRGDGFVTGMPPGAEITIEAADMAVRRTGLFLALAMFAASRAESSVESGQ